MRQHAPGFELRQGHANRLGFDTTCYSAAEMQAFVTQSSLGR